MGFVRTTHICGGIAVLSELSIGQSDISCGGNKTNNSLEPSCSNKNHSLSKKPCCENSIFSIELDDKFKKQSFFELQFIPPSIIFAFEIFLNDNYQSGHIHKYFGFTQTKDILIWYQSFLI